MLKILNKILYILKNILLPITFVFTIYIIVFMFKRLDKELFGANFLEFLEIIIPFIILLILYLINSFLNIKTVKDSFFYNLVSFLVVITIFVFCYRAFFDNTMYLWYKYEYNINFNYFTDQIPPIKVMLYGLSLSNILLIIQNKLLKEKVNKKDENKT